RTSRHAMSAANCIRARQWRKRCRCPSASACGPPSIPSRRTNTSKSSATGSRLTAWTARPSKRPVPRPCNGLCSAGRAQVVLPRSLRAITPAAPGWCERVSKRVEVAAGIIFREDGAFLLGRRAPGTFYAGYWEFPGGKVEAGEDAAGALVRELDEELGIRAR